MTAPASPPANSEVRSGEDPRAEIGVLFVHGIGEHAEGDTLLSFGEPLIDWLREWLEGPADGRHGGATRGRLEVPTARMRARRNEAESPAYARVDITAFQTPSDDHSNDTRSEHTEHWLFAEAWWGDSVKVPAALQLLVWMLLRTPLLVYWHFLGGSRLQKLKKLASGDPEAAWAMVAAVPRMAISCAMALALQAVIVVSIVLWAIPFGPWRQALLSTVRKLAAVLGDSFVLLEQDIQRATLIQRVRSGLEWLQARTERLVVIAHSQGAAIAHSAIQASPFPKIRGYISVGSGLEKLELLRLVRKDRVGVWPAQLLGLAVLVLVLVALQPLVHWSPDPGWAWLGAAVLMLFIIIFAATFTIEAMKHYEERLESRLSDFRLQTSAGQIDWCDVYAGMDLVPMGKNSQLAQRDFVEQIRVTNEASFVGDHVRYFETPGDFAPRCWALLSSFSSVVRFTANDEAQLERARRWHRARAIGLVSGQWLNPLTALVSALLAAGAVLALGESLMTLLNEAKLSWPHSLVEWTSRRLADGLRWLLPIQMEKPGDLPTLIVGALTVLLGLVGWWLLVLSMWRASNQHLAREVARGNQFQRPGLRSNFRGSTGVALWTLTAMLPLLSVVLAHYTLQEITIGGVFRAAATLTSGLFWTVGALFSLGTPLYTLERIKPGERPDPDTSLGLLGFSLFGGPFYCAIGYGLWVAGQGPALGPAWLPALLAVWGGVITTSTLFSRQVAFRPSERWGVVALYVGGLVVGWYFLSGPWPLWWPLVALVGAAAATLVAGFLSKRPERGEASAIGVSAPVAAPEVNA